MKPSLDGLRDFHYVECYLPSKEPQLQTMWPLALTIRSTIICITYMQNIYSSLYNDRKSEREQEKEEDPTRGGKDPVKEATVLCLQDLNKVNNKEVAEFLFPNDFLLSCPYCAFLKAANSICSHLSDWGAGEKTLKVHLNKNIRT